LLLAIKKNIANPSINVKEPIVPSPVIEEPKKPEVLPQINVDKSPENKITVSIILLLNTC